MKPAASDTCLLAAGQPASIQQPAGLGGFARVLSMPRDSLGVRKGFWEGRAWAGGRMLPSLPNQECSVPGAWGRKGERWARLWCDAVSL